jgi:hypothetical protein
MSHRGLEVQPDIAFNAQPAKMGQMNPNLAHREVVFTPSNQVMQTTAPFTGKDEPDVRNWAGHGSLVTGSGGIKVIPVPSIPFSQ